MRLRDAVAATFDQFRFEPAGGRIRAESAGVPVVDTVRAVLVWEPRRVTPTYAVPAADVLVDLVPALAREAPSTAGFQLPDVTDRPVLDPRVPFAVHTVAGEPVDVGGHPGAGFRLAGPELAGYVVLDFSAFERWHEEDRIVVGHPRDPFHRVDVLPSSRHVQVELDGVVLADSARPSIVLETMLPARCYLPAADVLVDLDPSPTRTTCAYKGHAGYFSARVGGSTVADVAWSYPDPLPEAAGLRDLVAFFDERVDVVMDGERRSRPVTPWS